jgi:hypothetical protein
MRITFDCPRCGKHISIRREDWMEFPACPKCCLMEFWYYADKVSRTYRVHRGDCGACKHGTGMHGHQRISQNEWPGPFQTFGQATADAQAHFPALRAVQCRLNPRKCR